MNQDIARLRPAAVVPASAPLELIGTRAGVLAKLREGTRAGVYVRSGPLRLVTRGPHAGRYAVTVVALDRPPRRAPMWAKACLATGSVLLLLAGLGWWAVASLGAVPLLALLLAGLGAFIALVRRTQGPRATVTVTTTVEMR